MAFWVVAAALALVASALLAVTLIRTGQRASDDADLGVYRDQLASVERDLARGVVGDEDAERLRTEIKRRILDTDRQTAEPVAQAPRGLTNLVALAAAITVVGGSGALYVWLGAPGYPDLPLKERIAAAAVIAAERPGQSEAEARIPVTPPQAPAPDFVDLMERLRAAVSSRPDDGQGLRLLVRNEARLGNYGAAAEAQAQLVQVLGAQARATDWAVLADLRLTAAEGALTPAVAEALDTALAANPAEPLAVFLDGLRRASGGAPLPRPRALAQAGDFVAAHRAQARLIELLGPGAQAGDYADLADLRILAAGGYVSPEAEAAIDESLARDPENGTALYYRGLMFAQTGRPDRAFQIWERQLRTSAPNAPWLVPIRAQIETAAAQAGVEFTLPAPDATGPTVDQVAAASEMSAVERQQMIEGMVQGLSDRLASEGGPPEDWARLIRALGVLGRTDHAAAVWAEAQSVFPDADTRAAILAAAQAAGVAQ